MKKILFKPIKLILVSIFVILNLQPVYSEELESVLQKLEILQSDIKTLEDLGDHTVVIPISNTDRIIILNF